MLAVSLAICVGFFLEKSVCNCESDGPSSSDESRGVLDGAIMKSSLVASIHICVRELLFRLIMQTWYQKGSWENDFYPFKIQ